MLTEADVRDRVKALARARGGIRALARQLGVSPSYVSDVCNGRRAPGPPFLRALGLHKVTGYQEGQSGEPSSS
jgi:DNA-binding transcriptional regulator YdaS (Cro superfamily)